MVDAGRTDFANAVHGEASSLNVLVTGGAGYVGSHTVRALRGAGHRPIVYDNLSTGHQEAVAGETVVVGDVREKERLVETMRRYNIEAIVHFAARSLVGESMTHPAEYYENNVVGGIALLEAARACGVRHVVFSSTAAVYGEPGEIPIPEEHPLVPTSVYGRTKLAFERILQDYGSAYGFSSIALRYFNAAGADPSGEIGEDHDPETHLIPIVLQTALGLRESVTVFGTDYPTPDGTCIRDYVHVCDLATAHVLALERLNAGGPSGVYNLGNGEGFSVREVIETAERVTGRRIAWIEGPRRPGDPARLIASQARAERELGWKRTFRSLQEIVESAWKWHRAHPAGFGA